MTLCIAAECRGGRVIVGSDFRGETDSTSAENQNKLKWIEHTWPVLIAGTISRAYDLLTVINLEFKESREKGVVIDSMTVGGILEQATRKQKYRLAAHIVSRELGIPYATFLKKGKEYFSDRTFEEIEYEIRQTDLECELIVVFFDKGRSYLYSIGDDTAVNPEDNFCCIGSGADLANSSLYYREHEADQILRTSLYRVYEAHQMATRAPGVGENFAISVFRQDKKGTIIWERLSSDGLDALDRNFVRFGPKRISGVRLNLKKELQEYERAEPPKSKER